MKQKILLISAALVLCAATYAQVPYYGTPFYKEGFDAASFPLGWVQSGLSYTSGGNVPTTTAWSTINSYSPSGKNFVNADPNSTYSLLCTIPANTGLIDTLTSPIIVHGETELLCVGFSVFDYTTAFPAGYGYLALDILKSGDVTWTTLWTSNQQSTGFSYTETDIPTTFSGWKTIRINLPAEYNGQIFQMRFRINSPALRESPAPAMSLLIDGFFASKQRAADARIASVNDFSAANALLNKQGFLHTPIAVQFSNQGYNSISSINVGYKVSTAGQPDQIVNETYTLPTPLSRNETATYTLAAPADLSLRRTTYTLKTWVSLSGEEYRTDDTLVYTLYNIATDAPYKPAWLTSGNAADEWTVVQENTSTAYPTWTQGIVGRDTVSYCNALSKTFDANSYYFSRPVYLKAGKTYELKFNTFTSSDNPVDTNSMQVFWTAKQDTNARIGNYLFSKNNINNARFRQNVYVTPTQDSVYYFVFRALCKAGSKPLYIQDIAVREVKNIDGQVISLQTPANKTYRYTNNEAITVRVGNGGMQSIAAGAMKVYYQLGNNARVEETISVPLAMGETIDHAFTSTINMEELRTYNFKTGVVLGGDENVDNDDVNVDITPWVTELPYNGSLGTNQNNRSYEEEYWTSVNNKWAVSASGSEVRWSYGGTGGSPATAAATLYSRPIHINAGVVCGLSYSVARSNASATVIPSLKVGVYQKTGSTYNLVTLVNDTVIKTAKDVYSTYTQEFIPAAEGDYYFGYVVTPPASGLTYQVYLKEPNFTVSSHTVSSSAGINGEIAPAGDSVVYSGRNITYTIIPNASYMVDSVIVNGVNKGALSSYTLSNVQGDSTIRAVFRLKTYYTVSASVSGGNGRISPAGDSLVVYGSNISYTITPNTGYTINQVLINGANNAAAVVSKAYTFSHVTQNQSIAVSFAAIPPTRINSARVAASVVYPNPVPRGATVRLHSNTGVEHGEVRIFDINGKLQSTQKVGEGITMPNRAGIYFLQVNGLEMVKVVVE